MKHWKGEEVEVEATVDVYVGLGNGDNGGFYKKGGIQEDVVLLEENLPDVNLPETLPEDSVEVLKAKLEAMTKIAEASLGKNMVDAILKNVEAKNK